MARNPFKFLDSFEKADKDRFFGRDKETGQLFNAVHASNLVLVYGGSGTGKTSLVMCGLANQFHDTDWLPLLVRRSSNINKSLQDQLATAVILNQNGQEGEGGHPSETARKIINYRNREGQSIPAMIQDLYFRVYRPVYLIFDQFEELYIMGSHEEQAEFHETVKELLSARLQCKILIIIREEYIAYLSEFEKIVPPLFDNRLRIEKMNDRNLAKVITGTARYGGIRIDDKQVTVPAILDNLRTRREGVDLTNLQVYMDRLWRRDAKRQGATTDEEIEALDQIVFDPELIEKVGPMQNVLSLFLDEQMQQVEEGLRARGLKKPEGIPLEVLFTLVTEDGTKRNMTPESILADLPPNRRISEDQLEYCLDEFYRIRLLRRFGEEVE
ncbi:MAG: ATP-binding protein [Saprospiraceae bacterium]|nr:ATP-binding protein [Saprospiraceae bacterium]